MYVLTLKRTEQNFYHFRFASRMVNHDETDRYFEMAIRS